jgi:hypothetical protein
MLTLVLRRRGDGGMGRGRFGGLARRLVPMGAVFALLSGGCSLLPSVLGTPTFQAATLAPADAWSFTDVTLRPSVQQALFARDVFNFYADQASLNELPTPSGGTVNFEKDVLPLLDGEVAVALSGTPEDMQGVLLIHTTNVEAVLRLMADETAPKFTRDARGATRYANGRSEAAGYKNWVVFANDDVMLAQTLDRIDGKGGPNLASQSRYQTVVARLSGDHLGFGYLDVTPLLQSPTFRDLQTDVTISAKGRLAYSLAFAAAPGGGMRALDLRTEYISETLPPPTAADHGDALYVMDRLPVGNAIALSGPSMGQVAESLDTVSADAVPHDLLTLVHAFSGPYAFGVSPVPSAGLDLPSFLGSLFFLGQLTPAADAEAVHDLIAAILDENADESGAWHHEVVTDGDWTAVNIVPASLELSQVDQQVLASDRLYQAIRPALAQDGSNAYINVGALLAWTGTGRYQRSTRGAGSDTRHWHILAQRTQGRRPRALSDGHRLLTMDVRGSTATTPPTKPGGCILPAAIAANGPVAVEAHYARIR